jgi:ribosome maturation factor RimP
LINSGLAKVELYERLKAGFSEIAVTMGLELVEIKIIPLGGRLVIRAIIHKPGGVTIADCRNASNAFSDYLDIENLIEGKYVLEVSSIGLDTPLFTPADYRRRLGESVRLEMKPGRFPRNLLDGKVLSAEETALKLESDGQILDLDYREIIRGKIIY